MLWIGFRTYAFTTKSIILSTPYCCGLVSELFDTTNQNIGQHISNILVDSELQENSVVKDYLTTYGEEFPLTERTLQGVRYAKWLS